MSKLVNLINSLRAHTIVIIENDFVTLEDPMKLLANYSLASEAIAKNINSDLIDNNFIDLGKLLSDFREKFQQLKNDAELIDKIVATDNFEVYLAKINQEHILDKFDFEEFTKIIDKDEVSLIKKTFLKYGIFGAYIDESYVTIIDEIKKANRCDILYFNNAPSTKEEINFINPIKKSLEETNSSFYLCLIDRNLGNGSENEGREFIEKRLLDINAEEGLKSICFIYTSKPDQNLKPPDKLEEYYFQEVKKTTPPDLEVIARVLAQSAYATVFDNICENFYDSAESTLTIVLKNQKNIKYIIDKSHQEGISPYDSIKYWYNLLLQKSFEENEINDYSYVATLSSFFKNEFLDDHQNMSDIDKDIKDLNNYELFDDKVNDKLLPIAPGDIWYSNGIYYILMGQLCDMLIRSEGGKGSNNIRNGKIGELLKLTFEQVDPKKDKYYIDFNNNKKYVYIQNFIDIHGHNQNLKIDVSTPNVNYAELRVLDLCMFNLDGECKLNIYEKLEPHIINMLYENKDIYFESLQKRYKNLGFNNLAQIISVLDDENPIKFGASGFVFDSDVVDYRLRRISRLKGRYYDSLYNNFINNKGRIDLNLIDNSAIISKKVNLKCEILHLPETVALIDIDFYFNKEKKYFLKKDFFKFLKPEYNSLLDLLLDEIDPFDNNHFSFIDDDENYQLSFLIKFTGKSVPVNMITFDYRYLFKSQQNKYKALSYSIAGKSENLISFDRNLISLEDLKTGIEIPETKEKIMLNNGIITINSKE